jgi:ABC-2 type transport system permease protein
VRALAQGFAAELRLLAGERRYRLMLALFFGAVWLSIDTYHASVVRDLPVAVLDMDGTRLSRMVRLWLESTPELAASELPPTSLEEAHEALVDGRLAGVVLIPDGFAARVKGGKGAEAVIAVDMSNVLVGRTVQRAIGRVLGTLGAGVTVTTFQKLGEPARRARVRAVPVTLAEGFAFNPTASYAVYLAPAYGYFFLHIFALFVVWSVLARRAGGPATSPARLGGLAAVLLVTVGLGLLVTYAFLAREGIAPASSPAVVVVSLTAFLALDLLAAAAIREVVPAELLAFQITVLLGMLSFVFSGLTWPADMFPAPIRALSELIPFTPFGRAFRLFLHEPTTFADLAPVWRQMLAQAALYGTALGAGRLTRTMWRTRWSHS